MRRALDSLDAGAEVTTRLFDNLNAGTRTMRALLDSESMRRTAATLNAANKARAALDYSKLAELWSTPDMNVTLRDLAASAVRSPDDLNEAPRASNEATGLPAPQPLGAAHPVWLLLLLALSVTHVEEAPGVVLAILREMLFALRLLSVVEDLDRTIPGLLLLSAVVGIVITLFQSADRE